MNDKTQIARSWDAIPPVIYDGDIAISTRVLAGEHRKMREALETCKQVFDWHREIRGSDGALKTAVDAVNDALGGE